MAWARWRPPRERLPNNSTTLNLIILQSVAMQIARDMNISLDDFKRNHPGGHIGKVLGDE